MARLNKLLWLPLLLLLAAPVVLAEEAVRDVVRQVKPAVVTIVAHGALGEAPRQGSGFYIDSNHVVTNWHVVVDASRVEVKDSGGKSYRVRSVSAHDRATDLAILALAEPNQSVTPLRVASDAPEEGERIVVVGSPLGLEQSVSDGIVSAVRQIPGYGKVIQISAPVSPGSSGSPVVNLKGEVVGVTRMQLAEGQNLNFATPGQAVLDLQTGRTATAPSAPAAEGAGPAVASDAAFDKGLALVQAKDYAQAIPYLEAAARSDPRNYRVWFLAGVSYFELGKYQQAMVAFKQSVSLKPDFVEGHTTLANAYAMLSRYKEAVSEFEAAIRISPAYAPAHFGLALVYLLTGNKREALQEYGVLKGLDDELAAKLFQVIYAK